MDARERFTVLGTRRVSTHDLGHFTGRFVPAPNSKRGILCSRCASSSVQLYTSRHAYCTPLLFHVSIDPDFGTSPRRVPYFLSPRAHAHQAHLNSTRAAFLVLCTSCLAFFTAYRACLYSRAVCLHSALAWSRSRLALRYLLFLSFWLASFGLVAV